jgi:hypothetical protein
MASAVETPRRGSRFRVAAATLLVAAAAVFLIYGGGFHKTAVMTERTVALPLAPKPAGDEQMPGFLLPKPSQAQPTKTETVEIALAEPAVVEDITIGGLTLGQDGKAKRTYSGAAPVVACPT